MPIPFNKTVVSLFVLCNFYLQAVYLHHNHILPGLLNICSRFNYHSPTGVSVFRINQSLLQPVPGQSAETWVCVHHLPTPVGHVISETHRTQALALRGLQGLYPSINRAVMTDSIRFGIGGNVVLACFFPHHAGTAVHSVPCERRRRLLWDMNHTIHCPHVTEGITPSQVWTMASKLELNSGLAFTTWSSVLSPSGGLRGYICDAFKGDPRYDTH